MKPIVSFIAPAHRTERWRRFHAGIVTKIPHEIIFVTDKYPHPSEIEECPNLRWIYSKVKPAQCFEIAYRESKGDFIVWTGDDFSYPDFGLDKVLQKYNELNDYRKMISFIIHQDGTRVDHFLGWDPKVVLTTTALISKKAIEEVGGLADIRFPCGHWDCDLMLRIGAIGGEVIRCEGANAFEEHESLHKIEYNFGTTWASEWEDFKRLYSKDGKTIPRSEPFKGYDAKDILYVNQGAAGKWKAMEQKPTVSIILPSIRPWLIHKAIDSCSRGYSEIPEIIIVADYDAPAGLGTNVKWFRQPRTGVIPAINFAYQHVTGEYVFLTNDDSVMKPLSIDSMVLFSKMQNDETLIGIKVNENSVHQYWGKYFAAWIFARKTLIDKINDNGGYLLDPAFTSFYADPDLSLRAYAKGIAVRQCPNAHITAEHIPADQDIDNSQKNKFYHIDQKIFIARHRHLGKFHPTDSEMENIKDLI